MASGQWLVKQGDWSLTKVFTMPNIQRSDGQTTSYEPPVGAEIGIDAARRLAAGIRAYLEAKVMVHQAETEREKQLARQLLDEKHLRLQEIQDQWTEESAEQERETLEHELKQASETKKADLEVLRDLLDRAEKTGNTEKADRFENAILKRIGIELETPSEIKSEVDEAERKRKTDQWTNLYDRGLLGDTPEENRGRYESGLREIDGLPEDSAPVGEPIEIDAFLEFASDVEAAVKSGVIGDEAGVKMIQQKRGRMTGNADSDKDEDDTDSSVFEGVELTSAEIDRITALGEEMFGSADGWSGTATDTLKGIAEEVAKLPSGSDRFDKFRESIEAGEESEAFEEYRELFEKGTTSAPDDVKAGLRFAIGEAAHREDRQRVAELLLIAAQNTAEANERGRISGSQSLLAAGHLLKESIERLEELDIGIEAFHGADELEKQLQAHAEHPELVGTQTLADLTQAARVLESVGAASDEEIRRLSKTISEILESGELAPARLDEPIEAAEKMAIDAYSQVYSNALVEVFDNEVLRKAFLATSSGIGEERTESEEAEEGRGR